jgi:SMI1 / KNR4 family (SUKH-1)
MAAAFFPPHAADRHDADCDGAGADRVAAVALVAGFFMRGRIGGNLFTSVQGAAQFCLMTSSASISDQVTRIAQKIRDRGIQLGSPLCDDKIRRFEQHHGISLPEGFRAFLLHSGNGGAGPPLYGLESLGEPSGGMTNEEARLWSDLSHVCQPFPFSKTWVWEAGDVSEEGTHEQIHHGCIYVGNDGCGMYWYVIVTGPEHGNVWMICGEGLQPTSPKRDFLQWYEDWLDGEQEWWK